ncbi:MAG: hypothetical protein KC549_09450 [Myxococcales bacterium]|nr:hypothetical protein [Myxococcales bacterium]MCB9546641.1 hypothetical protein [Myxococcales bacterium]
MRALLLLALLSSPALADGPFWPYWSDGKAELAGYDLVQPRYGEKRHGRAVLIFVTEPFSRARGVKVDHYNPNDPDHFTALKLNAVRKFQTGIYDYSVMTSVFVDPANGFAPAKVSFSSQEWCGHVFEEARFGQGAKVRIDSYFEGETTQLDVPVAGSEDALFITLRGLGAEALATEPVTATLLPSALDRRLRHQPAKPAAITVQWGAPTDVTVPAGKFSVRTATWNRGVGGQCQADVEVAWPHRIIGWRCDDGEEAKLLGVDRIPYWQTHGEGNEALLQRLGLKPMGVAP